MLNKILGFTLLALAVILTSCGDDDTINNPVNPPGTVLYSADSMAVNINTMFGDSHDSISYSFSSENAIKVEFTLQSNADSTHALGYYYINTNSTPATIYEPNIIAPIDQAFSTTYNTTPLSTYINFSIRVIVTNGTVPYYVKLKNIKVTKL